MTMATVFAGNESFQQGLIHQTRRLTDHLIVSASAPSQSQMAFNLLGKSQQLGDVATLARLLEHFGGVLRQSSHGAVLDRFFRVALERTDLPHSQHVRLASLHALLLIGRGELDNAEVVLNGAWHAADTPPLKAELYNRLGVLQEVRGNFQASQDAYERALVLAQAHNQMELTTRIYNNLGNLAYVQNRYEEALVYYQKAIAVANALGDVGNCATAEGGLAMTLSELKRYDQSLHYHQVARRHFEEVGHEEGIGRTDVNMSLLYIQQGNYGEAKVFASRALVQARRLGDVEREATAFHNLGYACLGEFDYESAYSHLAHALEKRCWMGMPVYIKETREVIEQMVQALETDCQLEADLRQQLLANCKNLLKGTEHDAPSL
jgi:tetratricopeptide (TPR) repeat protein